MNSKTFRSKIILFLGFFILSVVLMFNCMNKTDKEPKEILFGAIMPLTGDAAVYGKNCKQGIELAVEEINTSGGIKGMPLKVLFEDSQLQPRIAISSFEKLATVNKVQVILGPLASSCAMATASIANKKEVISFSPGASTPKLTDAGPYVFRNWQSDALEAIVMANYALKQGWKKFDVLYVNNDFGITLKNYFVKKIRDYGGTVNFTESFEQGDTDFRTQLTKIKSDSPDAIYLLSYPQQTPNIINQIKILGIKSQILGVAAMEDPSLIEIAGKNAEGILYTIAKPLSDDEPIRKKFIKNYEKKFGEEPGLISDTGYDAVFILSKAIEKTDELSGYDIQKALSSIKKYSGASGEMTFDENGDVIKPIGIKTIHNGKFIWISS